ncbi:DUF481 domain-containing protein [Flavicella sp.]|uniref:DUF481 domain-containing protein n=1 Tax=Flavicella sp. TaxID=2957742 RepID=UPI002621FCD8|nr:DUF481 domain-containing protein [Flavicella sp.]MDG1804432.1 DUF481 domain-containing protein [Flavicella sp.]
MYKLFTTFFLLAITHFYSFAQNDSLVLVNGNIIDGDLKSMDKGVLTIEPTYSDSDFKIKWEDIKEMKTFQRYLITLSDGRRINGTFRSSGDGMVFIANENGADITIRQSEIVTVNSVDSSFLSRISANIDFGLSLTKANNQRQLNGNLRIGYIADTWSTELYYNTLLTAQDDVEDIQRNDAGLGARYFLPSDWNLSADIDLLSNTEQSLDLRTTAMLGVGNYIIHTNASYWNLSTGMAYNNESFSAIIADDGFITPESTRNSVEGFIGTELNLYDVSDLNLFTNIIAYPTIVADENVEAGRFRTNFRFDAKYDDFILKDFYVRAGYTLNYDNRPVEEGKEIDYVFTTGFGWEW